MSAFGALETFPEAALSRNADKIVRALENTLRYNPWGNDVGTANKFLAQKIAQPWASQFAWEYLVNLHSRYESVTNFVSGYRVESFLRQLNMEARNGSSPAAAMILRFADEIAEVEKNSSHPEVLRSWADKINKNRKVYEERAQEKP